MGQEEHEQRHKNTSRNRMNRKDRMVKDFSSIF